MREGGRAGSGQVSNEGSPGLDMKPGTSIRKGINLNKECIPMVLWGKQ